MITNKQQASCIVCSSRMHQIFTSRGFDYFRCPNCLHVTTFPYPTRKQIQEHYTRGFKEGNYNVAHMYSDVYYFAMGKIARLIEKNLCKESRNINKLSVLDIGCFTGDFLYHMKQKGANVYGIEFQEEAAKIANNKLPNRIFQGDIFYDKFPFSKQQFDVITILGVVEHVVDPIMLFEIATGWLKKDGILVMQTPNSASFFAKAMRKYWLPYTPIEHIHLFSKKSLFIILNKLGFKNIIFRQHWKILSISYVYSMLQTFSPEFYRIIKPFYEILPDSITNKRLPFYVGEIIALANC